jgi:ParB family chromosome partitioning protein
MKRTEVTPGVKVQILRLLGNYTTAEVAGHRFGLDARQVVDMAANHGYPDPEKMTQAAEMLAANMAAHPTPPVPVVSAHPGQHVVSLDDAGDDSPVRGHRYAPVPTVPVRAHPAPERTLQTVLVTDLYPDPDNPRERPTGVAELADSIESVGLLQPILARRVADDYRHAGVEFAAAGGRLVVVAGARRLAAVKHLGWATVDVIIRRDMPADDILLAMLAENGQRTDLDPIEEARAYRTLQQRLGLPVRKVAARVGRSEVFISGRLAMLALPVAEQELIRAGQMNIGDGIRMARGTNTRTAGQLGGRRRANHLGVSHPLAKTARAQCSHMGHKAQGLPQIGGGACGGCWESVIRADERVMVSLQLEDAS